MSPFSIGERTKTVELYKRLVGSPSPELEWTIKDEELYEAHMRKQEWEVFVIAYHSEGMPVNWLIL